MILNRTDSLLPLAEVTDRLRVTAHSYAGVCSIPLDKIIGSVDRASEFDRDFHPQRRDSEARMRKLEAAFPSGDFPAISVFEVGSAYFVSDGHHRVALAHQRGQEFIEAEVVQLATNYRLTPDVNIPQLVHTELRRMLMEESGLQRVRPDLTSPSPIRLVISNCSRRSRRTAGISRGASTDCRVLKSWVRAGLRKSMNRVCGRCMKRA